MAAAERLTIKITATDSLNSCCRLGQTTSLSSSKVAAKKPPLRPVSAGVCGEAVSVSSEVGLVTNLAMPELTPVPWARDGKQASYWTLINGSFRFESKRLG